MDIGIAKIKIRQHFYLSMPRMLDSWIRRRIKILPIFLKARFGVKSPNIPIFPGIRYLYIYPFICWKVKRRMGGASSIHILPLQLYSMQDQQRVLINYLVISCFSLHFNIYIQLFNLPTACYSIPPSSPSLHPIHRLEGAGSISPDTT